MTLGGERQEGERRSAGPVLEVEDFLLQIRGILHAEGGRDANILTHELQERVADALGYPGDTIRQRVEALMGVLPAGKDDRARAGAGAARGPPARRHHAADAGRAAFEIAADGIRFADPPPP